MKIPFHKSDEAREFIHGVVENMKKDFIWDTNFRKLHAVQEKLSSDWVYM